MSLGNVGHGQVLEVQALQRPPQHPSRQLRARLGRLRRVLPPHLPKGEEKHCPYEEVDIAQNEPGDGQATTVLTRPPDLAQGDMP